MNKRLIRRKVRVCIVVLCVGALAALLRGELHFRSVVLDHVLLPRLHGGLRFNTTNMVRTVGDDAGHLHEHPTECDFCAERTNKPVSTPAKIEVPVRLLRIPGLNDKADPSYYCPINKVGSSATLAWAQKVVSLHEKGYSDGEASEFNRKQALSDQVVYAGRPQGMSFVIVRDPFTRLISGFKHWVQSGRMYRQYKDDFEGFVNHLVNTSKGGRDWHGVDKHFKPQSLYCALSKNRFDYEFKLEDPENLSCFLYSLSKLCPFSGNQGTTHHTNTTSQDVSSMFTETICDQATLLYKADMERFEYPGCAQSKRRWSYKK